jgi:NTE family protein
MHWSLPQWLPFPRKTRRRPLIGLALGGGGMRGMAHLGVLEVLEREGVRADLVSGVSAGSVVGALYCAGYSVEQIHAIRRDMSWSRLVRPCRPRLSLLDTTRMELYLDELLTGKTFDQLSIPLLALGLDILSGEEIVLREGRVARAVRASCAVPGVFPPIEWGDYLLIDGGVRNNLPVRALREAGAEYIIAVSLVQPHVPHRRPRNLIEMWLISADAMMRATSDEADLAECTIRPNVEDLSMVDFRDADELVQRGRNAAEATVGQLRSDLRLAPPSTS